VHQVGNYCMITQGVKIP